MSRIHRCTRLTALMVALTLGGIARADEDDAPAPSDSDSAAAETPLDYESMLADNLDTCVGSPDVKFKTPTTFDLGGFHYSIEGATAHVTRTSKRKGDGVRFGVLNAIKDNDPPTVANVDSALAKFKDADVDAIIIGGDTAYDEDAISTSLKHVASLGVPVYAIIGNAESTGSWNHALQTTWSDTKNVLNLDLLRVVVADGFDLVTLPGYFDRKYAAQVAPCIYTSDDAGALSKLATGLPGPTFLVSHGPPHQTGKLALDYTSGGANVGDQDLADGLTGAKIPFGIFGHIVEAGGRATDLSGKKEIRANTWVDSFYLNPGSANSVVWGLNGGGESYGMAALVSISGKKAKYEIFRSPKPKSR